MTEAEVKVFMPGLVEKCGQPQPNVKADCRCDKVPWLSQLCLSQLKAERKQLSPLAAMGISQAYLPHSLCT